MQRSDEKTTVPNPSAATDGEQPLFKEPDASIADFPLPDNEDFSDDFFRRINNPGFLPTYSMPELYGSIFHSKPPIIQNLLYPGTYLFAGAPKIGKSFLMAQLAFHVSSGKPLWNFAVQQGTVLYLALEDNQERLQQRLYRMFGTDVAPALYFSNAAKPLGGGLDQQIETFRREHPDTNLVIIDTLQKVRESGNEKCSYASDYEIISKLKSLAEKLRICLLLVHHTRKQQAEDRFDMISGTNGLLGCADGALILQKEFRTAKTATLDISGRDQQDQRLYLLRDEQTLAWNLERQETELWNAPPDPVLSAVASLVTPENTKWCGSSTELAAALGTEMKPNALSMRLNIRAAKLEQDYHIRYESIRTHAGRQIILTYLR